MKNEATIKEYSITGFSKNWMPNNGTALSKSGNSAQCTAQMNDAPAPSASQLIINFPGFFTMLQR